MTTHVPPADGSLEGVVVARTAIAHVDGVAGRAVVRGYLLPALAERLSYEDVAFLVLTGELPRDGDERARFGGLLRAGAALTDEERSLARGLARGRSEADALAAAGLLVPGETATAGGDCPRRCPRARGRAHCALGAVAPAAAAPVGGGCGCSGLAVARDNATRWQDPDTAGGLARWQVRSSTDGAHPTARWSGERIFRRQELQPPVQVFAGQGIWRH